jgi:hypothetical protein
MHVLHKSSRTLSITNTYVGAIAIADATRTGCPVHPSPKKSPGSSRAGGLPHPEKRSPTSPDLASEQGTLRRIEALKRKLGAMF